MPYYIEYIIGHRENVTIAMILCIERTRGVRGAGGGGGFVKYDILNKWINSMKNDLRPNTVKTYFERMDDLLTGQSILNTLELFDINLVIDNLSRITYKNQFSQSKNALLYFLKYYNISLDNSYLEKIELCEKSLKRKNRKLSEVKYSDVVNEIANIRNKKLKLSYQTMLSTALRVSELSSIEPENCHVTQEEIIFSVEIKGGKIVKSVITKDENLKLYNNLKKQIEDTDDGKKVFYSANYLQQKCETMCFRCHDLRRLCAKSIYKKTKSKEKAKEKLNHCDIKTTEIYLKSKAKID